MKKYKCMDCGKMYFDEPAKKIVNNFFKQNKCKLGGKVTDYESMVSRLCEKCSEEFGKRLLAERAGLFTPTAIAKREETIKKINETNLFPYFK